MRAVFMIYDSSVCRVAFVVFNSAGKIGSPYMKLDNLFC